MAAAACKTIINKVTEAVTNSLREILLMPETKDAIGSRQAEIYLEQLLNAEIAMMAGSGGAEVTPVLRIVDALIEEGVLDWRVKKVLATG